MAKELSELAAIRQDRVIAWCSINNWTEACCRDGENWEAIPPGETEYMLVPRFAVEPLFPGYIPKDS